MRQVKNCSLRVFPTIHRQYLVQPPLGSRSMRTMELYALRSYHESVHGVFQWPKSVVM